jgi:hypothetical protein
MKLELLNNGLHSIYHALEEIDKAESSIVTGREFDSDDHMIHWRDSSGNLSFYLEGYSKPPPVYSYKFAILNLIQGLELVLKSYLHERTAISIFRGNKGHTINLHEAVKNVVEINPDIFNAQERLLIEASSDIRNEMQHYEFVYELTDISRLTRELYFLAAKAVKRLFNLDLYKHFEFNQWTETDDKVADIIKNLNARLHHEG